jgi:hypothetical protein
MCTFEQISSAFYEIVLLFLSKMRVNYLIFLIITTAIFSTSHGRRGGRIGHHGATHHYGRTHHYGGIHHFGGIGHHHYGGGSYHRSYDSNGGYYNIKCLKGQSTFEEMMPCDIAQNLKRFLFLWHHLKI